MAISPALAITEILALALRREPRPTDCDCGWCRQCIGRRNGLALYEARGREYFVALGRQGGRPKEPTIWDIRRERGAAE